MQDYESFSLRLKTLKSMDFDRDISEASYRSHIISQYNVTLTTASQALRTLLKKQGTRPEQIATPQEVLIQARMKGYIKDSGPWVAMLQDKKMNTFFWDETKREERIEEIRKIFIPAFDELEEALEEEYASRTSQ